MISNNVTIYGNTVSSRKRLDVTSKTQKVYGLNFPIGKNIERGFFSKESGLELVKSMVRQAVRTETGERLMLPDFGCGLKRFLFEALDEQTFSEIRDSIVRTITKYVPGADILKLKVAPLDIYGYEGLQALVVTLTLRIKELESVLDVEVEVV